MASLKSSADIVTIWDTSDNSQCQMRNVTAREWLARDPARYTDVPPAAPGPLIGLNRRIVDGMYNLT